MDYPDSISQDNPQKDAFYRRLAVESSLLYQLVKVIERFNVETSSLIAEYRTGAVSYATEWPLQTITKESDDVEALLAEIRSIRLRHEEDQL